jgi:hypothetical protein
MSDDGTTSGTRTPAVRVSTARSERGQAAVEFGLVVPFICGLVLALVHFGKAMNYWLDLNHVAAEGARKAAVNAFPSAAQYQDYLRDHLETAELKAGGSESVPAGAEIAICLPEGGDIGKPVTVRVSVGYHWIPFIGATTWTIRGSATMRLEQDASFSAIGTCT